LAVTVLLAGAVFFLSFYFELTADKLAAYPVNTAMEHFFLRVIFLINNDQRFFCSAQLTVGQVTIGHNGIAIAFNAVVNIGPGNYKGFLERLRFHNQPPRICILMSSFAGMTGAYFYHSSLWASGLI
jgi:hypothetical protein